MTSPESFSESDIESLAKLLPGYRIDYFIAAGGMGAVYQARQISLDRDVALKVLPRALGADPEFRKSFQTEARAMARLNHPNLISVFDSGEVDGMPYIVMEYVDGCSLFDSANGTAVDPSQAVDIVLAISAGLAHAHAAGIIHRDVKPANVLLNKEAVPKLGDFGLARPVDHHGTGLCMGTPGYTAPEVMTNPKHADKRSDLYAVGVILYELLTGHLPGAFAAPPSAVVKVDAEMDRIWAKATHPDPRLRYPNIESFVSDLRKWQEGLRKRPKPNAGPAAPLAASPRPNNRLPSATRKPKRKISVVPAIKVAINLALLVVLYFVWKEYERRKQHPPVVIIRSSDSSTAATEEEPATRADAMTPTAPSHRSAIPASPSTAETKTGDSGQSDSKQSTVLGSGDSSFPVGLWHNRRIPQIIVTLRQDGSCVTTMGHSGSWTWTGESQAKTLILKWTSGTIDTFSATSGQRTLEGSNQGGSAVIMDKIPDVADVPMERFLGDWIDARNANSLWKFHAGGRLTVLNFKTSSRMGEHTESSHTWERGPGGERITVYWDGNRKWFNVLTLMDDPQKIIVFNQRAETFQLMRAPVGNSNQAEYAASLAGTHWSGQLFFDDEDGLDAEAELERVDATGMTFTLKSGGKTWSCQSRKDEDGVFHFLSDMSPGGTSAYSVLKGTATLSDPRIKMKGDSTFDDKATGRRTGTFECILYRKFPKTVPADAASFGARRFAVIDGAFSWPDALERCVKAGGHLAVIPDQATHDFVSRLAGRKALWFGATDEDSEGDWKWVDGQRMKFRAFRQGEPNDRYGTEDYGCLLAGGWNDLPSSFGEVNGYVCEWEGEPDTVAKSAGAAPAQNSGDRDTDYWKNKAREDFPALGDPKSKMSVKLQGLKKDKESITPSFFKNTNWPYQLAWESALWMNDANPKNVDLKTPLFRGRFYKVFLEKYTWPEAQARCRAMRGRLAVIPDDDTNNFLTLIGGKRDLWVGATDEKQEGKWVWSDQSEMKFQRFWVRQPDNARGAEHYLMFREGGWNDAPTEWPEISGYICEWWKANE